MDTTTVVPPAPRRKRRQGIGLYKSSNGRFYLDCWIRGQRIRQSFGAIDERLARELATAARAAVLRGNAGIAPVLKKDVLFEKTVREFRDRHVADKRANTQRIYSQDLDHLSAYFREKRLSEIGPLTIEGYRKWRTKGHTVARVRCNREVALLRTLFSRMNAWGLYEGANPVRTVGGKSTVGRYQESRGRERVLTLAEEARLMAVLPEPYRTLVLLGLHTGVRLRSEGLSLTWEEVDLERARLTIRAEHAKNGSARVIPLSGPVVEALRAMQPETAAPGDPVFLTRAGRRLRDVGSVLWRAARRAKVSGVSPHVFRHTWASRFMQSGGDLRTLMTLGGWRTIGMVIRYSHSDEVHAAAAVAKMVEKFGAVPVAVPAADTGVSGSARKVTAIGAR
jgi:integrase/recombinase XerD